MGVRDCRGCRLKLSRWVLTSGFRGGRVCPGGGAGGVGGRSTSSSSLSERRRDRVELQSDTDERDRSVRDVGRGGGRRGLSRLKSLRVGGLAPRLGPLLR